ncbi:hypothetical protein D918_05929 [Trichuris suis]|nr:hypothetical protein D918_05929 [Trichuris suis]
MYGRFFGKQITGVTACDRLGNDDAKWIQENLSSIRSLVSRIVQSPFDTDPPRILLFLRAPLIRFRHSTYVSCLIHLGELKG